MNKEDFGNWLKDKNSIEFYCTIEKSSYFQHYHFVKAHYNNDVQILYGENFYHENLILESHLRYQGMIINDKVYDMKFECADLLNCDYSSRIYLSSIKADLSKNLQYTINDKISKMNIVRAFIDTDECKYDIAEKAEREVFAGNNKVNYSLKIQHAEFSTDTIINFIVDPDKTIEKLSNEYLKNEDNKLMISEVFKRKDLIQEKINEILEDNNNIVHLRRKIASAVTKSEAKTVNVTINVNNREFTFKTEADTLKRNNSYYSSLDITAQDRYNYKKYFGHYDYKANDIVSIKYGKNTIYSNNKQ
jgi:hypothetical protein